LNILGIIDEMDIKLDPEKPKKIKKRKPIPLPSDYEVHPGGLEISRSNGYRIRLMDLDCASIAVSYTTIMGESVPLLRSVSIPQRLFDSVGIFDYDIDLAVVVRKDKIIFSRNEGIELRGRVTWMLRRFYLSRRSGGYDVKPGYYPVSAKNGRVEVDLTRVFVSISGKTEPVSA